ncbi:hypothetical protein [Edwardsiella tarda]|uniref:hypothetical protein n=1 Tax=Edwardsiella tarda TaxID=636 RepID=UPI003F65DA97
MMKPLYLKFESKNNAESVLLSNGFKRDEAGGLHSDSVLIDVIGVIPGKLVVDSQGNIVSQGADLPGWHVNLLAPDDYVIQPPNAVVTVATPVRKWAGY